MSNEIQRQFDCRLDRSGIELNGLTSFDPRAFEFLFDHETGSHAIEHVPFDDLTAKCDLLFNDVVSSISPYEQVGIMRSMKPAAHDILVFGLDQRDVHFPKTS